MKRDLDNAFHVRPLVLDGALGTELEKRGVDTSGPSWSAKANLKDAPKVFRVYKNYLFEGADILTTNTFRTNPRALKDTGLDAEYLTKRAVRIARKARRMKNPLIRIAGSIAPVEDCFSPELAPASDGALIEEHRVMVRWLAEAKVDIILIETMSTLREALCALEAVREETDLYPWVSIVPKDGESMLDDTPLDYAVKRLAEKGAHLIALNCAPVSVMREAMPVFSKAAKAAGLWFGCYPNASERNADGSWNLQAWTDDEIADLTLEWMKAGASLVGGCCGTTPETISEISMKRDLFYVDAEGIFLTDTDSDMPF